MKRKSKPNKKQSPSKRGPFFAGHPLNGVPLEIRKRVAAEIGARRREKFEDVLPQIVELISSIDPLHTLALMSTYGLMGDRNNQGGHQKAKGASKVTQGHVEFLQALCLRNRLDLNSEFPEPERIQKLFDWLPEIFRAYQEMRIGTQAVSGEETSSKYESGVVRVQAFLRAHTAAVRNWGYFGSVTRISRELLSKIDHDYEPLAGMALSKTVDIFEGLIRRHERKINEHRKRLHSALSLHTKDAMLEKFFAVFEFKGSVETVRSRLANPSVPYEHAKWALLSLSDRLIAPTLVITNQEIAAEFGLDLEAVAILTNRVSLAFTDLEDEDPQGFFLNNPVWMRPLIYMQKDYYFCPVPQTLMSFVLPIAEQLLVPFDGLQQKLAKARATFLEDEVARLFETAFPGCAKSRGFKWKEGGQQFESDLVFRFDTTLVLVESKSGRVSWPALRGAPDRLIEHVNKLIVEPSDQSGRLAQRLEEDIACLQNNESPTLGFPLALTGVTCVVRLSVMLDDFGAIQSVPSMLTNAGILKNKFPLAPCMSLADLEVMLDILETPYFRLHYIRRRAELLMTLRTVGDELDMLGMYLDTAMNLGTMQRQNNTVINLGYSLKIDRYYSLRDESLPSKKPRPNTSEWFKGLCAQLEERARPGWSEISCALLSIAPVDQREFERLVRAIATKLKAGKPLRDGKDTMALIPPGWSNQALAFQLKSKYGSTPFGSDSQSIAQHAFEFGHVNRCVVMVIDATDVNLSYLSAAVLTSGEKSDAIFY